MSLELAERLADPEGHSLKRSRSPIATDLELEVFIGIEPPKFPLPQIGCDLILEVFTHASLCQSSGSAVDEQLCDNERLAALGESVLDLALATTVFKQQPFCSVDQLRAQRKDIDYSYWSKAYGLQHKLCMHPRMAHKIDHPEVTRTLFQAYVGAAFIEHGMDKLQIWISQLFAHKTPVIEQTRAGSPAYNENTETSEFPPMKRIKQEADSVADSPELLPLDGPDARLVSWGPNANPMAPAEPTLSVLYSFMQACGQRGVTAGFHARPDSDGTWIVDCIVNDIKKGVGYGRSKQIARENAARDAYYAMGWV